MADKCTWGQPYGDELWDTNCGHEFVLNEGTPAENGMKFCPFCGRELKEKAPPKETGWDQIGFGPARIER